MIAHIICGSPNLWLPSYLTGYIVGVDRGALKLIEKNFNFDVAIGDFDSVSKLERQLIEVKVKRVLELPVDKDVTDCEAAVEHVVGEGYCHIYLYGATGARFDHQFATIGLMLKYAKRGIQIYMEDAQNEISVLAPGMHHLKTDNKKYVSFFALESMVKNLILQGVKYPLEGYDLSVDDSLCVSNEDLGFGINISFDSGYLLAVQSSD
jgi:thiamine pyrophosphokinase